MNLSELCQVIQDIAGVAVTLLQNREDYISFCNMWKFHDIQDYLNPDILEWLLHTLGANETLCYLDYFRMRFVFIKADCAAVAIGPYCTEILSESDYRIWEGKAGLPALPVKDVLVYRDHFPVMEEDRVLHLADCLVRHLPGENIPRRIRRINAMRIHRVDNEYENQPRKPYAAMVQERYRIELELMENIRQGQGSAALKNWKALHSSVTYLKRSIGDTIENARISAAITRTVIRIAGTDAGLPAELGDWITSESAAIIRRSRTIAEINHEHERLIDEYCTLIHAYKTNHYSSIVLSAIYQLDHLFQHPISIGDMAAELDVSTNYFISRFRKETGLTPGKYLLKKRLSHAAALLTASTLPIQEICVQSGIADANYFIRLFRREYGETPARYRKRHHL